MRKTALVLLLLAAPSVWGDDVATPVTLTLDAAQKEALEHSPVYRKAQDAEREAGWGQLEAVSKGFLPHVHAKGQYFLSNPLQYTSLNVAFGSGSQAATFSFPGIFPEKTLALDADIDLFDGFRNVHNLDAANNRHEAAKVESDFALLQLGEEVRLKFYEAVGAKLLSHAADENVKTLEDHLKIVQDQLDNGQATKYDRLTVEVKLSEAKSDQMSAHDNEALAREALAQAMGLARDDRPLADDLPSLDAAKLLKEADGADSKDSPELRAQQLQASAATDQSAASGASFWVPRVSLVGEYEWYNSPNYYGSIQDNPNFANAYFLGASASWDLLDGGESLAKAQESEAKAKQAQADYEAAQLQTSYDFDRLKRRLASSLAIYQARQTDVVKATENVRLARAGREAGTRTTTDELDAEFEKYHAEAGLVEAQLDAVEAFINLELLTGKRLDHD